MVLRWWNVINLYKLDPEQLVDLGIHVSISAQTFHWWEEKQNNDV